MTFAPFALVPLTATAFYLSLLLLVRRSAGEHRGARAFTVHVGFLAAWSAASFAWRLSGDSPAAEYLLRLLEVPLFSIPATFVLFLQSFYPSRSSLFARRVALATIAIATIAALSGAINRVGVDPEPPDALWPHILFYGALAATVLTYGVAFAFLVKAFRATGDPFDRNRLTYAAIATALIMLGSLTNLAEALRVLPVDQAANASAATLLALAIVRYRLFDINVVLRRGAIHGATAIVTSLLFGTGVVFVLTIGEVDLLTREGTIAAAAVAAVVGMCVGWVRTGAERLLDRTFIGTWARHEAPLAEIARRTERVQSVADLAHNVTAVVQAAVASSFVTLLVANEDADEDRLRLVATSGPFPRPPEQPLRASNTLLRLIAADPAPVTPARLHVLVRHATVAHDDAAELEAYLDCVIVALRAHGRVDGFLVVGPKIYAESLTLADIQFLEAAATRAALALENARLYTRLRDQAETDYLTGLPNHRRLQDLLADTLRRQSTVEGRFAIAMVDIDNFKLFNEVHGHQTGDDVLRRVAGIMRTTVRAGDVVGRYGGDEFLIVLEGMSGDAGRELMSRLARSVRKVSVDASGSELAAADNLPVRITWGLAAYPEDASEIRGLVSIADSQLLQERFKMRRSGTVRETAGPGDDTIEHDARKLRVARGLLDILDTKDPYTSEHSQQIAAFALLIADEAKLSDRERYALWLGSLLHDVGKIGTPVDILRKPGKLTPEEVEAMRRHPSLGETLVRGLLAMDEVTEIVGCHHERWDGAGYPRGLAGEEIPRLVRLVSVADAFSAMVHDRPYRKGLAWSDAVEELRKFAGTQFDPDAVETFVRAIGHGRSDAATEGTGPAHGSIAAITATGSATAA